MALADRAELAVRLTLDDRSFTGPLRRVSGNLGRLDRATGNTQRALGRTGAALQRTAVIAAAAATGGFLAVVRAAGDFEDAFAGVRKTVEASPEELDALRQAIRDMALEIPVAATELAAIGETAGALGIHVGDIDEFINVVARLGATTDLTTDAAAESLGKIGTILGLTGQEFEDFADVLVNLGNKGASTESEIIEITKRFAASGKQAGLTIPQILAYASAIASAGAEPEAAGSSLSRLFGNLITETANATDKAKAFASVAGLSFKDFAKLVKTDTSGAMELFLDQLNDLDKFEAQKALKDVGITNVRDRNAILLLAQTYEENLVPALKNAEDAAGSLDEESRKRFDTFNSKLQIAKQTLTDVGITIGDKLLPKITPLLDEFSAWVKNNGPAIDQFGDDVASAFTDVVDTIRNLPWDSIKGGLAASWGLIKTIVDGFKSLPGPLQAALIGGFALNKVTGGLVTGVGKDVATAGLNKLLTGSILGRGASPANPMWVQMVGGPGGVGGKGGGVGGLVGAGIAGGVAIQGAFDAATILGAFPKVQQATTSTEALNALREVRNNVVLFPPLVRQLIDTFIGKADQEIAATTATFDAVGFRLGEKFSAASQIEQNKLEQLRARAEANRIATVTAQNNTKTAIVAGAHSDRNAIVTAIAANRPIVNVDVRVNNTTIRKSYTTGSQVGRTSGPTEYDH